MNLCEFRHEELQDDSQAAISHASISSCWRLQQVSLLLKLAPHSKLGTNWIRSKCSHAGGSMAVNRLRTKLSLTKARYVNAKKTPEMRRALSRQTDTPGVRK